MQETKEKCVRSLGQEDPLEKKMTNHSNSLAWKFHGQRSLLGYSPWDSKKSDVTGGSESEVLSIPTYK